jgi:hypothetical protein
MSDEIGKPPFDTLENAVKEAQRRRAEIGEWKIRYSEAQNDLRDWFAGQALAGLVQGITGFVDDPETIIRNRPRDCAELAYTYAEAMLTARRGPPQEGE